MKFLEYCRKWDEERKGSKYWIGREEFKLERDRKYDRASQRVTVEEKGRRKRREQSGYKAEKR